MDSKKVNVNGKCRLQGALYVDVLEGRMLPLEGTKRNNLTGDLLNWNNKFIYISDRIFSLVL